MQSTPPSEPSSSVAASPPKKRQLQFRTFGEATVSFLNVFVANANQALKINKRSNARQYTIETDGSGSINIAYDHDDAFTVSLSNRSRWVTTLYVKPDGLAIGNVGQALSTHVSSWHVTKSEPRNIHTTLKIENRSVAQLKRIDVRGHGTTWFSVFSHQSDMLMCRPNGDWLAEKMLYLTDQMTTQAINNYQRTQGLEVLPSQETATMRRRQSVGRAGNQTTRPDEATARITRLLEDEHLFEQQLVEVNEKRNRVQDQQRKYEQELASLRVVGERVARLKEEQQHYAEEKAKIMAGLVEVGNAGKELLARRLRLQEEKKQFETDQREFEKLKLKSPALVTAQETQTEQSVTAQETQTEQASANEMTTQIVATRHRLVVRKGSTIAITFKSA